MIASRPAHWMLERPITIVNVVSPYARKRLSTIRPSILPNYRAKNDPRQPASSGRRSRANPLTITLGAAYHRPGLLRHEPTTAIPTLPDHLTREILARWTLHRESLPKRYLQRRGVTTGGATNTHRITIGTALTLRGAQLAVERQGTHNQQHPEDPDHDPAAQLPTRICPHPHLFGRPELETGGVETQWPCSFGHGIQCRGWISPKRPPYHLTPAALP